MCKWVRWCRDTSTCIDQECRGRETRSIVDGVFYLIHLVQATETSQQQAETKNQQLVSKLQHEAGKVSSPVPPTPSLCPSYSTRQGRWVPQSLLHPHCVPTTAWGREGEFPSPSYTLTVSQLQHEAGTVSSPVPPTPSLCTNYSMRQGRWVPQSLLHPHCVPTTARGREGEFPSPSYTLTVYQLQHEAGKVSSPVPPTPSLCPNYSTRQGRWVPQSLLHPHCVPTTARGREGEFPSPSYTLTVSQLQHEAGTVSSPVPPTPSLCTNYSTRQGRWVPQSLLHPHCVPTTARGREGEFPSPSYTLTVSQLEHEAGKVSSPVPPTLSLCPNYSTRQGRRVPQSLLHPHWVPTTARGREGEFPSPSYTLTVSQLQHEAGTVSSPIPPTPSLCPNYSTRQGRWVPQSLLHPHCVPTTARGRDGEFPSPSYTLTMSQLQHEAGKVSSPVPPTPSLCPSYSTRQGRWVPQSLLHPHCVPTTAWGRDGEFPSPSYTLTVSQLQHEAGKVSSPVPPTPSLCPNYSTRQGRWVPQSLLHPHCVPTTARGREGEFPSPSYTLTVYQLQHEAGKVSSPVPPTPSLCTNYSTRQGRRVPLSLLHPHCVPATARGREGEFPSPSYTLTVSQLQHEAGKVSSPVPPTPSLCPSYSTRQGRWVPQSLLHPHCVPTTARGREGEFPSPSYTLTVSQLQHEAGKVSSPVPPTYNIVQGRVGYNIVQGRVGYNIVQGRVGYNIVQGRVGYNIVQGRVGYNIVQGRVGYNIVQGRVGYNIVQGRVGCNIVHGRVGCNIVIYL